MPICIFMRPRGSKAELEARRGRAVAMLEEGKGVREVARLVGASPSSVGRWREAYDERGEEGLNAKPHPGAKPKLSDRQRDRLAQELLKGPGAHGYSTELWTLRRVAEVIERRFGVRYNHCHVWRVLGKMGWSCQRPERPAREQDERAVREWREKAWPRIERGRAAAAAA